MTPANKDMIYDKPAEVEFEDGVPKWMVNLCRAWTERWGLGQWRVYLRIDRPIENYPEGHGLNNLNHNYLQSHITLIDNLNEKEPSDVRTVIHEVQHIPQAELLHFVHHILIPQLPKKVRKVMRDQMEHIIEQYSVVLTDLLYRMALPYDYPERMEPLPKDGDYYAKLTLVDAAQEVIDWTRECLPALLRDRPEFAALEAGLTAYQEALDAGETDPDPGTIHAGVIAKEDA